MYKMDPSIFLQYTPPSGLPQESKLVTYMSHTNTAPSRSLNETFQSLSQLRLDSPPPTIKKPQISEFVPVHYYSPIVPESPQISPPHNLGNIPQNAQLHQNENVFLQENVGGTTYFYSTNSDLGNASAHNSSAAMAQPEAACLVPQGGPIVGISPYATQMYMGPPPHMGLMTTVPGLAASFYMPETIRAEIYERNDDAFRQADPHQYPDLPENVDMYTDLVPLETPAPHSMGTVFKVTHRQSGEHYALRRLHNFNSILTHRLEMWKQVDHPNIVKLHEFFTTQAFGDHSLIMVYDYHPACENVMNKYLSGGGSAVSDHAPGYHDPFSSDPDAPRPYTHQKNAMLRAVASGVLIPEAVLWSIMVQLTAALRSMHTAGLACRSLDATKVVMNGCRVRISFCGIADALRPNVNDMTQAQQDDLTALGRLALALACRTIHCDNLQASIDLVARTYSADFKNFILYLLTSSPTRRSVTDLMPMIGARFYTQVEALERRSDAFEGQLALEIDNGRLMRILMKLGVVNERPEFNMDPAWSETGDRYMLKLFRDHLFHSVTELGEPWLDQAHVVHCLNQLDAGSNELVELRSRDERSVLVITYAELKHCLESSFNQILAAASPGTELAA